VSDPAPTQAELARRHPDVELYTIVGSDAAAGLRTWERHEEVVERSRLVVVERPGVSSDLPDGFDWIRVEVPHLEVSSTDLRARVIDGRPLDYLVPENVLEEVRRRRLYQGGLWHQGGSGRQGGPGTRAPAGAAAGTVAG
jgi:nicotinate-nucleotide adenylyltransferase